MYLYVYALLYRLALYYSLGSFNCIYTALTYLGRRQMELIVNGLKLTYDTNVRNGTMYIVYQKNV